MGDPERPDRLRPLPRRLQHQRHDARGQGQAHPLPQPPRDRRGLALRQGPLRLLAPPGRRPAPGSALEERRRRVRAARVDRRARPRRGAASQGRACDRHRALGLRDGRAGLRPRQAAALRARRARGGAARGDPGRPRRVPRAALLDPQRRNRRRPLRRAGGRAGTDRRPLDQGGTAERRLDRHRAARRAGRQRRPDHRRCRDRGLDGPGAEGDRCLLSPTDPQRARRHRCVELRG